MWLTKRIIYLTIILLALVLAAIKYKALTRNMRLLTILMAVTFCTEVTAIVCAYVIRQNSFVYMAFGFIQIFLIMYVYRFSFAQRLQRIIALSGGYSCLLLWSITIWLNKAWLQVNAEGNTIKSIYIVLLCLLLFMEWLRYPSVSNILKEPMFWVNTGFFLFFSVNIFFWAGYNFFAKNNLPMLRMLEPIQYGSNLFLYLCICVSYYLFPPARKPYQKHE